MPIDKTSFSKHHEQLIQALNCPEFVPSSKTLTDCNSYSEPKTTTTTKMTGAMTKLEGKENCRKIMESIQGNEYIGNEGDLMLFDVDDSWDVFHTAEDLPHPIDSLIEMSEVNEGIVGYEECMSSDDEELFREYFDCATELDDPNNALLDLEAFFGDSIEASRGREAASNGRIRYTSQYLLSLRHEPESRRFPRCLLKFFDQSAIFMGCKPCSRSAPSSSSVEDPAKSMDHILFYTSLPYSRPKTKNPFHAAMPRNPFGPLPIPRHFSV